MLENLFHCSPNFLRNVLIPIVSLKCEQPDFNFLEVICECLPFSTNSKLTLDVRWENVLSNHSWPNITLQTILTLGSNNSANYKGYSVSSKLTGSSSWIKSYTTYNRYLLIEFQRTVSGYYSSKRGFVAGYIAFSMYL